MAKKDWELSHLQSLREEEERLAEEEADDLMLTYDRPEMANKVILRRRPSTGTWEVCSQNQEPTDEPHESESPIVNNVNHSDTHTPLPSEWAQGNNIGTDSPISGTCSSGRSTKHRRKTRLSEGSTTDSSQTVSPQTPPTGARRHSSRLAAAAAVGRSSDPSPSSPTKRELRQRQEDPEYKPPGSTGKKSPRAVAKRLAVPAPALLSSVSAPSLTLPASNHHVVAEEEGETAISSRTRQKSLSLAASSSFSPGRNQVERSPNHKYPTRHKLTNQT